MSVQTKVPTGRTHEHTSWRPRYHSPFRGEQQSFSLTFLGNGTHIPVSLSVSFGRLNTYRFTASPWTVQLSIGMLVSLTWFLGMLEGHLYSVWVWGTVLVVIIAHTFGICVYTLVDCCQDLTTCCRHARLYSVCVCVCVCARMCVLRVCILHAIFPAYESTSIVKWGMCLPVWDWLPPTLCTNVHVLCQQ